MAAHLNHGRPPQPQPALSVDISGCIHLTALPVLLPLLRLLLPLATVRPRLLLPVLILSTALQAAPVPPPGPSTSATETTSPTSDTPATELNLRTLGAIGDNRPHPVSEWIAQKRYKNLRDIQKDYPFVTSLDWSVDEVVFQHALRSLPRAARFASRRAATSPPPMVGASTATMCACSAPACATP